MRPSALPPVPALLLAMLSLQGGAAFAKTLFPQVGPLGAGALRITLAALVLALLFRPDLRRLTRQEWQLIVPYGVILGVMNMSIYSSFALLPIGLSVTLEFLGPLLLATFLSRRALDFVWVGLAGLGIVLMAPHEAGGHLNLLGAALALVAAACWAVYILIGGRMRDIPSTLGVSVGMLVAMLVSLPFGVAQAGATLLQPGLLLAGLAVAVLSSVIPYLLEMRALRQLSAQVFGVLMSLEPAIAALCGLFILHEVLSAGQWLGLLCVAAASAGISLSGRARAHTEPEPVN